MIILLILITSSHDNVWVSLGENCCWSLLGLKGLTRYIFCLQVDGHINGGGVGGGRRSEGIIIKSLQYYIIIILLPREM